MENILNKYTICNAINIIGDTKQVLQIPLQLNTAIVINKKYVSYASSFQLEEKPYHEEPLNIKSAIPKAKTNELIRLRNVKDAMEYIGLSNQNKIIKIIPLLYNNLFVRLSSILAFSDSIKLVDDATIQATLLAFFHKIPRNKMFAYPSFHLIQSSNSDMMSKTKVNLKSLILLRDILYLACNAPVIEKRLGENESITINLNGLIAFEKSVSLSSMTSDKMSYLSKIEDVVVSGPGLIIFETTSKAPINKMFVLMILGLNLLFITFFFLGPLFDVE